MEKKSEIVEVAVELLVAGSNDRKRFDPVALQELADSIQEHGLAQPVTVRPVWTCSCCGRREVEDLEPPLECDDCGGDGWELRYEIVAGERRTRAVRDLLGWATIPAIVRPLGDEDASGIMLIENVQRADLNPIEEAEAYAKRMAEFGWDVQTVARKAGVTWQRVRQRLALLDLIPDGQHLVRAGQLNIQFAYAMRSLDAARQQVALRWLHNRDNPSFTDFSAYCARLLTAQAQDSLFDLVALMAEAQAVAEAEEAEEAGFSYPVAELPEMKRNGTVGRTLTAYIEELLASGSPELAQAAAVTGAVLQGLQSCGLVRVA